MLRGHQGWAAGRCLCRRWQNARLGRPGRNDPALEPGLGGRPSNPISRRGFSRATPGPSSASPSAPTARRWPRPARTGPSGSGICGPGRDLAAGFFKGISRRSGAWPFILGRTCWHPQAPTGPSGSGTHPPGENCCNSATLATAWTASLSAPTAGRIATACLDRSVRLWDATTGRPLAAFPGHAAPVFSVTFSPDGKKLASASQDATVKVWDLTSEPGVRLLSLEPEQQGRSPDPIGWVGGLAFRPDGLELATGGTDQALAVWNLATARANQAAPTGWGPLTAVRYSPDGRLLASAGADRKVHIRDAGSLSDTMVLEDDRDGLVSLAFNPHVDRSWRRAAATRPRCCNNRRARDLLGADRARPVRLWDAKTGSPLRSLDRPHGVDSRRSCSPRMELV